MSDTGAATPGRCATVLPWRHPEARHALQLPEGTVGYALRRSARRRSIGLVVDAQGLRVAAPVRATLAQVEQVLRIKGAWIVRQLAEQHARALVREAAQPPAWGPQAQLPYLGVALALRPDAPRWALDGALLHVPLPAAAEAARWAAGLRGWLQAQARRLFAQRLAHFAPQLSVRPARLMLSSAATRWGSASSTGVIRLNWRLMHLDLSLLDYVVVHELAHLHEMNHSPAFWAHVGTVLPDFQARRTALRQAVLPVLA